MKKAEVKVLKGDEQQIEGKLVLEVKKVYVPNNTQSRDNLIVL